MLFRSFGPMEIALILGILLLLFGAAKLPALARAMGQSVRELKRGMRTAADDGILGEDEKPRAAAASENGSRPTVTH